MLPRSRVFRALCSIAFLISVASVFHAQTGTRSPASPFVVEGLGRGTVALDGPWQFHLGDDMAWANPAFDDSSWEQLTADKPWGAQGHPNNGGYGWYRRHILFAGAGGGSAGSATPELALYFPIVQDAYEVYWNGALVGGYGKLPPHPYFYNFSHRGLAAMPFDLGLAQSGVLAVRVWKAPPVTDGTPFQGGFLAPPVLGEAEAMARYKASIDFEWLKDAQFTFALNSLYALAALLALLAWMRDRRQALLFWMTGYCLAYPLLFLGLFAHISLTRDVQLMIFSLAMGIRDISLWFLLLLLLHLDEKPALARWVRRLTWTQLVLTNLDGPTCAVVLSGVPGWFGPAQRLDAILTILYTLLEALPLVLIAYAVVRRRRLDPARWLVAALAFLTEMIAVVYIAAEQGRGYTHSTLPEKIDAPLFTLFGSAINIQTLASTLLLLSIVYAVYRYSAEERRRQAALEQEFRNARELQQVLIPESLPDIPGFSLTSAYKPALEVGGDFFQIIPLENGETLIVLGDVSGKGLKAAMAVSLIVGMVRALANILPDPGKLLTEVNERLFGRLQGGFATAIALRFDAQGNCDLACAGHPAPYLNGSELILPGALPLGISNSASYQETALRLKAGDHLALYTDGLLEARSPSGELYSFERMQTLFATNPTAAQATEAAAQFGQDDDITVLILTRLGIGDEPTAQFTAPILAPA